MKQINCRPVPEVEINIDGGGRKVLLRFDVKAILNLQELCGGLNKLYGMQSSEFAALIVASSNTDNIALDEARELIHHMCLTDIEIIIDAFNEGIIGSKKDREDLVKNALRQYLKELAEK